MSERLERPLMTASTNAGHMELAITRDTTSPTNTPQVSQDGRCLLSAAASWNKSKQSGLVPVAANS